MSTAGPPRIVGIAASVALLAAAVAPQAASADIQPTDDANALAAAIVADAGTLAPGSALAGTPLAPGILPNATSDVPLADFPVSGGTYTILSSGDPALADDPNDAEDAGIPTWSGGGSESFRGDTDYDVSVLEVKVNVPGGRNCLVLNYRFLSEEFPEFVGTEFNDAFIAEIDQSTWTTSATDVLAPNDFATRTNTQGVTVNGVGPVAVTQAESVGTTYDAATGFVTTKTPITPGAHSVFLSILDQGDHIYDSAVFVDNLAFITEDPSSCRPPEVAAIVPPPLPPPGNPIVPPPPPPSNDFTIPGGSIRFKNGSTVITVQVPGPGTVTAQQAPATTARASAAAQKKKKKKPLVKRAKKVATKAGPVRLTIKPTKAGKKVLRRKKKLTVRMRITYTPTGGTPKSTIKKVTIKLKKKG